MNDKSISLLKKENAKLQQELAFTRDLLESANSIIIRWDKNGLIQYMNGFGLGFFGYSSEELIGQHLLTIVPQVETSTGLDMSKLAKDIANNPDQYKTVPSENITKDGRTVWVTWTNKGVFDEQGNVQEILAIGNDITALKSAEQKRFEYQEKLDAALEGMEDAVFISDKQGNSVHFNKAFATFHRFKGKNECLDRLADYPKILDVFLADGERLSLDQWVVARALRGETDTNAEYTLHRKDTGDTWIGSYNFGPFFDQQGNIAGAVMVCRDITEKKRAEEALRESEELLRVTLTSIQDPVFITDDEGRYTFICPNATNALGFTVDEFKAMGNISGLIGNELFDADELDRQDSLANLEKAVADKAGTLKTFLITIKKVDIGGGTRLYTMRDITMRKQAEELSLKQKYYLEKAQELGRVGSWDLDITNNILVWTDENCRIFGVPPGSIVSYGIFIDKVHPEDREYVDREWSAAIHGKPYDIEHRIEIAGETRWVREKADITFDAKGGAISAIGFTQEITERKLLEEHAKENEDRFTSAFEFASIGMAIVSTDGAFIKVNKALCRMLGYSEEAFLTLSFMDITYPDDLTADMDNVHKMLGGEINSYQMEKRYVDKQGRLVWCLLSVSLVTDNRNQPKYFISQILDISERKQAEERLLNEKAFLRSLIDSAEDVIYFKDQKGLYLGCNKAAAKFLGIEERKQIGKSDFDLFAPELAERIVKQDLKVLTHGETVKIEEWVDIAGSDSCMVESVKAPILDAEGQTVGLVGISRNITERKKLEEGLRESEERFKKMFRNNSAVMLLIAPESGSIVDANLAAESFYGYSHEELISTNINHINAEQPDIVLTARQNAVKGKRNYFVFPHRISNGDIRTVEVYSSPIQVNNKSLLFSIIHDISERLKAEKERQDLEAQLRQKYKMEAVGVMAGGMAHNFNNNLAIILGNLELSKLKLPVQNEVETYLEHAKIATVRSRDLVKQIMTYSRTGSPSQGPVQLFQLLKEILSLLQPTIPSSVKLRQEVNPDCEQIYIQADASQIQECMLNLCNNAVHAMEERGELLLRLERLELKQEDISPRYHCSPGEYLCLSVQDNGCGIPIEIQEKIFDPFFTTKELYEGTGMGLSTVQGIVEQHHGMVTVASGIKHGTTFHLYFPVIEPQQKVGVANEEAEFKMGNERILYVDDDEMIASLNERVLSEMGYQVTVKTDSLEALELFSSNPDNFDLVMADQTMPGLTGKELIQKIKMLRSDIPTILSTGYSNKVDAEQALQAGISAFLMKPTGFAELSQVIRTVLEKPSAR